MKIDVLVELKTKGIDQTFTYLVPEELTDKIKIGIRVLVPFGSQKLEGFVLSFNNNNLEYKLKNIIDIVDLEPVLTEEMIELGKYISNKTLCNLISAYQTMLPRALKAKIGLNVKKKYIIYTKLVNDNYIPKNDKQKDIINLLQNNQIKKSELINISKSAYNTLLKNEIIVEEQKELYRIVDDIIKEKPQIELNEEQKEVVKRVLESRKEFKPFLVHGVTGSGKTEVYMHILDEIIKDGKEAIVLVPEISLKK